MGIAHTQTRFRDLKTHKLLIKRFPDFQSLLYKDTWTVRDLPGEDAHHTMNFLLHANAIEITGETKVPCPSQTRSPQHIKEYTWREGVQDALQDYHERRDELPCGHRIHIHNPTDLDGYGCKYCDATYERDTIEALL